MTKSNQREVFLAPTGARSFTPGNRYRAAAMVFCAMLLCLAPSTAHAQVSYTGAKSVLPVNTPPNASPTSFATMAVDRAGNLYLADNMYPGTVAKLPASGGVYNVVLHGTFAARDFAVDQSGNIWVNDAAANTLTEFNQNGTALYTNSSFITDVTVDPSGDVYFSGNPGNLQTIRPGTTQPVTIAPFNSLHMAVDQAGNVYEVPQENTLIKVPAGCTDPSCAITLFSNGTAISGLATDRFGNLFIANGGGVVEYPAGCTSSSCEIMLASNISACAGIAVTDKDELFYWDCGFEQLWEVQLKSADAFPAVVGDRREITLNYRIDSAVTLGASPNVLTQGIPGLDFTLSSTTCTGAQAAGNSCTVTVAFSPRAPGLRMGAVQLTDPSGRVLVTTPVRGTGVGAALAFVTGVQTAISGIVPSDVAVDAAGNVFISDNSANTVVKVPAGCSTTACQTTVSTGLSGPLKIALDGAGTLYVADPGSNRVVKIPSGCTTASCQTTVGTGLSQPDGVAVDGAGNVLISDFVNQRILFARDNCTSAACQSAYISGFDSPEGLALDRTNGLYIAESHENRVVAYPMGCTNPTCQVVLASGLQFPTGVATDSGGGVFMTNDFGNQVVEAPAGCAGSACQTSISTGQGPFGLTVDSAGDLFIAVAAAHQVTIVSGTQASPISFPPTAMGSRSSPLTVTVRNIGNIPMGVANFSATANFAVDSGTTSCSFQLAPGATCNIGAVCTPSGIGNLTGTLSFSYDDALNQFATLTVPLSCSGTGLPQPTVTFTGAPAGAAYQSTFAISATTNASSMPVITGSGGCSVSAVTGTPAASSATVTMTSGTTACSLTANWARDNNFGAATASQMTAAVPLTPTVAFTGAPATAGYQSTFTVSSTSNASTTPVITAGGACSILGNAVTMTSGTGTCSLTATWAADTNYSGTTATQSTTANKIAPVVTFSGAPATANYQATFSVTSTTNASTTPAITAGGACSVKGTTVTMTSGTGTCSLTATWAADTNYNGTTATQSTTANTIAPVVTFTGAPAIANYQTTFSVTSTTNASTTAVITASGACSISGATVTMTSGTGNCSLTATWAADTNYSGTTATQSAKANTIAPVVTFTGAPPTANYKTTFSVTSTTNASTTPVITAGGACSISGATVTMTSGTGNCSLTATWAADTNYSGTTATQSAAANRIAPVVTFTGAPSAANYKTTFSVTSTTNSSTTPVITAGGACSISGATVTMTSGTGTCALTATWAADTNYSGTTATQSTTANKIAPVVTFTGAPASAESGVTFKVTATTNASAAASITATGACSVAAGTVTMTSNVGTCQLTATWVADANYLAASATQATQTAGSLTNNLITLLNGMNLSNSNSLSSQLQALAKDIQNNALSTACSDISTFIGSVNAQSGKKLTAAQAQQLLTGAAQIGHTIGCS